MGVAHSVNYGLLSNCFFSFCFLYGFAVCVCVCVCIEASHMCVPQYQDHDNHKQTQQSTIATTVCGMRYAAYNMWHVACS